MREQSNMKKKISYDYKFQGLLIETEDDEFNEMVEQICKEADPIEFGDKPIHHITYQKKLEPRADKQSTGIFFFILYGVLSITGLCIMMLGLYKLYEVIRDFLI